jgi:hypothetical protein
MVQDPEAFSSLIDMLAPVLSLEIYVVVVKG